MYRAGTDKTRFHVTSEYTTNKTLQNRFWAELRRISNTIVIKVGDMDFPLKLLSIFFIPVLIPNFNNKIEGAACCSATKKGIRVVLFFSFRLKSNLGFLWSFFSFCPTWQHPIFPQKLSLGGILMFAIKLPVLAHLASVRLTFPQGYDQHLTNLVGF